MLRGLARRVLKHSPRVGHMECTGGRRPKPASTLENAMADLEVDTRVHAQGDGQYGASLSSDWEIWGPNGGYLCAVALRAAGELAKIRRPVALYCHYLRVAKFAPVTLRVETLAAGRRAESLRVTMYQEQRPILEAMVRTAREGEGLQHQDFAAPKTSSPDALNTPAQLGYDYAERHAFWGNFEVRVARPERFAAPGERRDPYWLEWYRIHCAAGFDDPFLDAARSAVLLDTVGWPAAVQRHPNPAFIAPSLDFAAWFHASGQGQEWVLAEAHAPRAADGHIHATGRLFDTEGRLLASSGTQLLCTPLPPQP